MPDPEERSTAASSAVRHDFRDGVSGVSVTLVIPPGGVVFPAPGEAKIGVEHPGCREIADLTLMYDAFYCTRCGWNGRISGAWAADMIQAAP